MQKTGKDMGRREDRGVGMWELGRKIAAGSNEGSIYRTAVGGRWEMWAVEAVQYFAIVYLIGGIASMLWRGSTGVVWKVPLIRRTATFWATCRIWMRDLGVQ